MQCASFLLLAYVYSPDLSTDTTGAETEHPAMQWAEHTLEGECASEYRIESIFPINGVMGEVAQIGQLKFCQKEISVCLLPLIFILQQKLSKPIWYD